MLQYIPDNWPYDGADSSQPANKPVVSKTAFYFVVLKPVEDAAKRQFGCFKARQMAYFNEQRIQDHI